jgi:hypothetical protein
MPIRLTKIKQLSLTLIKGGWPAIVTVLERVKCLALLLRICMAEYQVP